ncbi:MAG: Hsp33 family molecular chaperone [Rhizobiaceae bacterium]
MNTRQTAGGMSPQLAGDDRVLPFHIDTLDVRGRAVQLDPMLNAILERHDYPPAVANLLGQMIVLTVLLGTSLKFDGKFIVQTQSDGPVSLLVVDFKTPDAVRAYARFDAAAVAEAVEQDRAAPEALLGKGVMAMTIDQGAHMQRYQGIVALDGANLEEIARQYFRQSEQIPTDIRMAVAELMVPAEDGSQARHSWRAGGVLVQFLPEAGERMRLPDLPGGDMPTGSPVDERIPDDAWTETMALMGTIAADELTDPQIGSERLLYRLFHEHGIRVFETVTVADRCSCSQERIEDIVRSLSEEDRTEAATDGVIESTCEFCSTTYNVRLDEL